MTEIPSDATAPIDFVPLSAEHAAKLASDPHMQRIRAAVHILRAHPLGSPTSVTATEALAQLVDEMNGGQSPNYDSALAIVRQARDRYQGKHRPR